MPEQLWKVLSMTQPWAIALFCPGVKTIETRSWRSNYRGRLYIHAAKGFPKWAREFAAEEAEAGRIPKTLQFGVILGYVDLVDVKPANELWSGLLETERSYGDYAADRFAWITKNPVLFDTPIIATGALGIWTFNASTGSAERPGLAGREASLRPTGEGIYTS